jgi:hypothetical protein
MRWNSSTSGQGDDGGGEAGQPFFVMLVGAHADEHGDRQADLLAVDDADAALDVALFLEPLDPFPAWRARQADLFAERRNRQGAVGLEGG